MTNPPKSREDLLQIMVSQTVDLAMILLDPSGVVQAWNPGAEKIFGYSEGEALNQHFALIFTPEDRATGVPEAELLGAVRQSHSEDRRWHLRKDGSRLYADGVTTALRDEGGQLVAFSKFARDVTSRKLSEQSLETLVALSSLLTDDLDYRFTIRRIIQIVCEHLGWEFGALWHADLVSQTMICYDTWYAPSIAEDKRDLIAVGQILPLGQGLPGRAWRTAAPVWIEDLATDENFPRAAEASRVGALSGFAFPISFGNHVQGVLEFFSRVRRPMEREALPAVKLIGGEIGSLLERRRVTDALRQSEERYRVVSETAHDAIFSIDAESTILFANEAAEKMFGFSRSELLGSPLDVVIPQRYRAAHHAGISKYVATGIRKLAWDGIELVGVRKDGSEFPLEVMFGEWKQEDRHFFTGFARDISERKRHTEERERLLAAAERANRSKDVFLATVSHELRTPITSILGWARILRGEGCEKETLDLALEMIENSAKMQEQLIEDILDLSRIVAGKLRLERREIDLHSVVAAAIESIRPVAEAKGVNLHTRLGRGTMINVDPSRLQQVIWNLVSNSVKFTPSGGKVEVFLHTEGNDAVLTVVDTGEGISTEMLPHIFEEFRQAEENQHGGLGLGLTIVKDLVQLHGGSVSAASEGLGRGAVFTVRLPLVQQPGS